MKLKDLERDIRLLEEAISGAQSVVPRVENLQEHVETIKEDMIDELQQMGHQDGSRRR